MIATHIFPNHLFHDVGYNLKNGGMVARADFGIKKELANFIIL